MVKPTHEMMHSALAYKIEHLRNGETELHGSSLLHEMEFEDWLNLVMVNSSPETVHENWVVASTFFVIRKSDRKMIGMVDIRHSLNDFLASYGGHIGYGVRPSERKKGYGTQILQMALTYARGLGLSRVMLACNQDNIASRKIIQTCGGVKEREFVHSDGKCVEVYWIELN